MALSSMGQLGIGTNFNPHSETKKLTLKVDSVGDGIWIGNAESLYPAQSTGYSDLRFTFRDYLTGGYTLGGEAIIRGYSESAYATQRRAALIFMTSDNVGAAGTAYEKMRLSSYGHLSFAGDTDTYIHHPEDNEIAITCSGGSIPLLRVGTGGNNATVGIKTDSNLVTNGEAFSVRGYSSFKSLNDGYAAIYTHNEEQNNSTIASHILFNVTGANRGGFGYDTDNSTLIMSNQNSISFRTGATQLAGTERLKILNTGNIRLNDNNLELHGPGRGSSLAYNDAGWEKLVFNDSYNTSATGPNKIILQSDSVGGGWYAGFGIHTNTLALYSGGDTVFYQDTSNSNAVGNERFRIAEAGNLAQNSSGGVTYFKGSSEYLFGSENSSPPAGGAEAKFQVHDYKTRATMSLNAYMNNAGAPVLQFVSSRSGTPGTLGTKSAINDYLGDIRFNGDNGTNYNSLVGGAQILARQKSTISDGDTTCAGEIQFYTGNNTGGSVTEKFRIQSDGKIRYGLDTMGIPGSIQGGGFMMYADNGSNNITRLTFTGLISGCYIATIGFYNAAGQGMGGAMFFVSGYQTANHTYDIHEVRKWDGASNSAISGVTKSGSNWYIEITNTHSSYNGGGEVNLYGDAQATFAVTYRQ